MLSNPGSVSVFFSALNREPQQKGEAMNIPIPAETPDPNIDDPELPVPKPQEPPPDTMPPVIEQPMGDPPSKEPPAVLDDVFPNDGSPE